MKACSRALGLTSILLVLAILGRSGPLAAAPPVDLHDLTWQVHIDLIDPDNGRDLAFWQGVVDGAVASANQLLEGGQGPFDTPCCTRLARSAEVVTFGSPGDGLDILDSQAEQNLFDTLGSPGSNAFLIDSISFCGGSAPNTIGCAELAACNGNADDDPALWMAVTVDGFDDGIFPSVIAHERGHNTCLPHVEAAVCQIMQPSIAIPGNAGCLAASECTSYRAGRTQAASGLECGCQTDSGEALADGEVCTEPVGGVCSGALCGALSGDAGIRLMAAADGGSALGGPPDEALDISALKGDWRSLGLFASTAERVQGLALARDSGVLYGVVPGLADDAIVTIDPETGKILETVGMVVNGGAEILSLAYDPGPSDSPLDDRLIALELTGSGGEFRSIDPASPSQTTLLGTLPFAPSSAVEFRSLAYDSLRGMLYSATPFADALFRTDLSTCPPSPCSTVGTGIPGLARSNASLTFSAETGMLYLVGTAFDGTRSFYDVIDPVAGSRLDTVSLDVFAPAGLAVVPEPGLGLGLLAGTSVLSLLARRRSRAGRARRAR